MTAVGYISDTEEIIKASWWNIQHGGAAEANCRTDHCCHPHCLQSPCINAELKHWITAEADQLIVTEPNNITIVHQKAVPTPTIGLMGMICWIIQTRVVTTGKQRTYYLSSILQKFRFWTPQTTCMWERHKTFPDSLGEDRGQWSSMTQYSWWSVQLKEGGL